MAKQDLVVKLLLDSGAFGNDLRTAERKAQEFSNNMKNAGKTAGDFGKEIGLSAGAIGKMGTALLGTGGVVAAVGAFKSVMMSTQGTAAKFQSTIAGFEGVLTSFQQALANMDFTNFTNGIAAVGQSFRDAKLAEIESAFSSSVYGSFFREHMKNIKTYANEYNNEKTTDEQRKKLKSQALAEVGLMREEFKNHQTIIDESVIKDIIKGTSVFLGQEISTTFADEQLRIIKERINKREKGVDTAVYNEVKKKIDEYEDSISAYEKLKQESENNAGEHPVFRNKYLKEAESYGNTINKLKQQKQDYISKNLAVLFRHQLEQMPADTFTQLLKRIDEIEAQEEQIEDIEKEINSWSKTATVEKTLTKGSAAWLQKEISILETARKDMVPGGKAWQEATAQLYSYKRQLKQVLDLIEQLDSKYKAEPLPKLPNITPSAPSSGLAVPEGYKKEGGLIIREEAPKLDLNRVENMTKNLTNMNTVLSSSIMLINGLGDAFANSEDEATKKLAQYTNIISTVGSGIMSLMQIKQAAIATNEGYAASIALGQAASLPFPANIAAIATVMGTVISVISTIAQITKAQKFAEGGIVGGTSYSGDKLFAMVNSGEMILNKRQQGNLANMLGGGGGQVEFHISGDALVGVLNNRQNKRNLTR